MSGLLPALPDDVVRVLGVTLLHFLWQGAALALILRLILRGSNGSSARYRWSMAALCVMGATPVLTFIILRTATLSGGFGLAPTPDIFVGRWEGWLVGAWLFGVAALTARALGDLSAVYRLRRQAKRITGGLARRCLDLAASMTPGWAVDFKVSARLDSPVVVGWLRPVVLMPVSALSRMPMDELEALILHELAHIRRLDPFLNLLQIAIETLLFYHPAVWWVSKRTREEREHCCDDLAVSALGCPASYVRALANIEEARTEMRISLAANGGGSLSARAKRLLGGNGRQGLTVLRALSFVVVLSITALGWGTMRGPGAAQATVSLVPSSRGMPQPDTPGALTLLRQSANIAIGMPAVVPLPPEAQPIAVTTAPAVGVPQPGAALAPVPFQTSPVVSELATASPEPVMAPKLEPAAPALAAVDPDAVRAEMRAKEIARQAVILQQAASAYALADAAVIRAQMDVEKTIADLQKAARAWTASRAPTSPIRSILASRATGNISSETVASYLSQQPIGKQYSAQMAALDEARKLRAQARADQMLAFSQLDALSTN